MKISSVIFIIFVLLSSCKQKKETGIQSHAKRTERKSILINNLHLDSIYLDHIESSYSGFLHIENDSIYFIDNRFGWVFIFNLNGELSSRRLGQGRGPNEIDTKSIDSYCFLPNGNILFLGSSLNCYLYDCNWNLIKQFRIDRTGNEDFRPGEFSPENPMTYTMDYERLVIRSDESSMNIYIPIYAEKKDFNAFVKKYYEEGRILEKVRISDGKVVSLLGKRSPEYLNYRFVGQYSFFSYDIDDDNNFFISHEIDSLIYAYNSNFDLIYEFGSAGKDMNTNYTEMAHFDVVNYQSLYFDERPKHGYYSQIQYIDETNMLFRTYKKSNTSPSDGLQIYSDSILIGDVNVPKDFKVMGYAEPYYYSGIIDEDNVTIRMYRFKLDL